MLYDIILIMKFFNGYRILKRDKYTYSFKGHLIRFIVIFVLLLIVIIRYLNN